jgi:hypothetical protein|nr:MAG TPA: hypothetical protein [Bacteriophage sp.]
MDVLTTSEVYCYDAEEVPPPKNKIVWVVSKFGVGRRDRFCEGFDVAWYPLPKVPLSAKLRGQEMKCK